MDALNTLRTKISRLARVQFERGRLDVLFLQYAEVKRGKPFDQARMDRAVKHDMELQKDFFDLCNEIGITIQGIK